MIMNKKKIIIGVIVLGVISLFLGGYFAYGKVNDFLASNQEKEENFLAMKTQLENQIEEQKNKIEELEEFVGNQKEEQAKEELLAEEENQKNYYCSEANRLQSEIKDGCGMMPYPGLEECLSNLRTRYDRFKRNMEKAKGLDKEELQEKGLQSEKDSKEDMERIGAKLEKVESLKPKYLEASMNCGVDAR
jgi:hypothetical protein